MLHMNMDGAHTFELQRGQMRPQLHGASERGPPDTIEINACEGSDTAPQQEEMRTEER